MATLKIGALALATGTNAPTVRYYEEIGLLPPPRRQDGSQRVYGATDVRRLTFIRRCRDFGFSIDQIRQLLTLSEDAGRSCLEARDVARDQLLAVRSKLNELIALERTMAAFVEDCEAACAGGPGPDCVIFDDLTRSSASTSTTAAPTTCCPSASPVLLHGAE